MFGRLASWVATSGSLVTTSSCATGALPQASGTVVARTGDACGADPLPLAWGTTVTASTTRGASVVEASCVRAAAPECLYLLDVPVRADVRLSLLSADFDGSLALLDATGEAELACVDDAPLGNTHRAYLDLALDPGQYVLVVDGAGEGGGWFELFAELDPLPTPEAACREPSPLLPGPFTRGSTRAGADAFSARCAGGAPGNDHVYSFALAAPSRVRLREQGDFDAVLSLRSTCTESTSELACAAGRGTDGVLLNAELPAGHYFAVVDGYARGAGGDYVLAFEQLDLPEAVPVATACAAATPISTDGARHELDTFYKPEALSGTCGGDNTPEALFRFALSAPSHVEISLSDLELEPVLYLRTSCEDTEAEVTCVVVPPSAPSEATSEARRVVSLDLPAGSYWLGVDGQQTPDVGAATVRVTATPSPKLIAGPRGL